MTVASLAPLDLTVHGAMVVASNGMVDVSAKGYAGGQGSGQGPGAGHPLGRVGSGGSHGGVGGGNTNGSASMYGLFGEPVSMGSGGGGFVEAPGGEGGGVIRVQAQSVQVDGLIAADGEDGSFYQ